MQACTVLDYQLTLLVEKNTAVSIHSRKHNNHAKVRSLEIAGRGFYWRKTSSVL